MISRPCYDKYRRCPGWAGPGLRAARNPSCDGGIVPCSPWRVSRCETCGLRVWPYTVRYLDPTWWLYKARDWKEYR